MAEQRSGPVVLFIGVLVLGALGAVLLPKLFGVSASPEADLIAQLKTTETDSLELPIAPGRSLHARRHQYARLTVSVSPDAQSAVVVATLDLEGELGSTQVSSLGAERVPFVIKDGKWTAAQGYAPRLAGIIRALEARRVALESGDPGQLAALLTQPSQAAPQLAALRGLLSMQGRKYTARAWFIRSERDEVLVTEDYRLEGTTPERPIDQQGSKRLTLERRGQEFLFSSGLM